MGSSDTCHKNLCNILFGETSPQFRFEVLHSLMGMINGKVTSLGFAIEMWKQFQQREKSIPFRCSKRPQESARLLWKNHNRQPLCNRHQLSDCLVAKLHC